ncbi:MAG TPA: response regulator transcription factor [Bryobacteraceae bacterium]|jgi:two-component system, OmpR family, KDP operon response regulator KdpE|nr:response regulator transcription factor [Bryobacteraceae bacterium]
MHFSAVSNDRIAPWTQRAGSAARSAETPLFSSKQVTRHPSTYPSQGSILIVDDDASVRRALRTTLQALGFNTTEASGGEEALVSVCTTPFDVVLLDINMPGMNGHEACRHLRRLVPRIGILMLTVRDSEEDKVNALEAGADDYVTKPFHIRELTARVRAAVRRAQAPEDDTSIVLRVGDIELDPARRQVRKANNLIALTPKEFDLLHYLMAHAGLPITHGRLLNAVWGPEYGDEVEYLRTYIRQLRKKIEDDAAAPKYLITDIKVGYRFWEGDLVGQSQKLSSERTNSED